MLIIYGGSKETVKKQLKCKHEWHGPCMGDLARYNKCLKCFCIEYDLANEKAYFDAIKDREYARELREECLQSHRL
jgi:hypothetical protein